MKFEAAPFPCSNPFSLGRPPRSPQLADVLKDVDIKKPRIPVISNVDAKPHSDPEVIKKILTTQVTNPVLWENTMASILERGFEEGFELGPGKVVAGIMKRIDKKAGIVNISV